MPLRGTSYNVLVVSGRLNTSKYCVLDITNPYSVSGFLLGSAEHGDLTKSLCRMHMKTLLTHTEGEKKR